MDILRDLLFADPVAAAFFGGGAEAIVLALALAVGAIPLVAVRSAGASLKSMAWAGVAALGILLVVGVVIISGPKAHARDLRAVLESPHREVEMGGHGFWIHGTQPIERLGVATTRIVASVYVRHSEFPRVESAVEQAWPHLADWTREETALRSVRHTGSEE